MKKTKTAPKTRAPRKTREVIVREKQHNIVPRPTAELLSPEMMEALVTRGSLSGLNPQQMVQYYTQFCVRLGLDPATQPFEIIEFQGKKRLYAKREACQQLNKRDSLSHEVVSRTVEHEICIVTARANDPKGRHTESIGAVSIKGLQGEALANAMMKAETKAKRRATLDLCGLGMLTEDEVETMHGARPVEIAHEDKAPPPQAEVKHTPAPAPGRPPGIASEDPAIREREEKARIAKGRTVEEPKAVIWRDAVIHFGKHKGAKLGDLTNQSIHWFYAKWMPEKKANENYPPKSEDLALMDAVAAWHKEVHKEEGEGVQNHPAETSTPATFPADASKMPHRWQDACLPSTIARPKGVEPGTKLGDLKEVTLDWYIANKLEDMELRLTGIGPFMTEEETFFVIGLKLYRKSKTEAGGAK